MSEKIKAIIIEDLPADLELLLHFLERNGFKLDYHHIEKKEEFKEALHQGTWDVILADYELPQFSAPEALEILKESGLDIPFIVVTGNVGEDIAVQLMKKGAHDYILKDELTRLPEAIRREISEMEIRKEKHRTQEALRSSERQYQTLFMSAPVGIGVSDLEGKLLVYNDAMLKPGNYTREDIKKIENVNRLYYDIKQRETTLKLFHEKGFIENLHVQFKRKDNTPYDALLSLTLITFKGETCVQSIIEDITDRVSAQKALQTANQRLMDIIEFLPDATFVIDKNKKVLAWNRAVEEMTGVPKEDIIGKGDYAYAVPFWGEPVPIVIDLIEIKEKVVESRYEYVERHGENIFAEAFVPSLYNGKGAYVWVTSSPLYDTDGNRYGAIESVRDITKRRLAEIETQNSNRQLMNIIEFLPDATFVIDKDKKVIFWNRAIEEMTGVPKEEIIGKSDYAYAVPFWGEPVPMVVDLIDLKDEEAESRYEYVLRHDNGVYAEANVPLICKDEGACVWVTASPLFDNNGNRIGAIESVRNITDRKQAEEELRESEEKFRYLFETTIEGVIVLDRHGQNTLVNPRMAEMTGYSIDELIGMYLTDLIHPEELNEHLANIEKRKKGVAQIYERRFVKKDGSIFWVMVSATPVLDDNGNYNGSFGMCTDITERKKAEQEILLLSRSIEQSPVSVVITDPTGNIEYINPIFTEVTGYTFEEVKGKNPSILKSGEHSKEFYEDLWGTILSGKNWTGEVHNKMKNGELFWVSQLISPIVNKDGDITQFVALNEDISEKKKMIDELIAAKEKAEEMNRVKNNFFANMSHELRTPFIGIGGYAELLAESLTDPELKEMAEGILDSSKRLTETLKKILAITELESEKVEVKFKETDIAEIIDRIHYQFVKAAEKKELSLLKEIESQPLVIKTDEYLLSEILINLVNNAIKFTVSGEIKISVNKKVKNNNEWVEIIIADTGIGIPKDRHKIIWQEFRQVSEGSSRSYEGTGLGLAIVKKYTRLLGGKIHLESEVGKGTTFSIELPMRESTLAIQDKKEIFVDKDDSLSDKEIIKRDDIEILYIEDDPHARKIIKKFLSCYYNVDLAGNSEIAVKKIKEKKYNALLMDINLGRGIDGINLSQIIRKIDGYKNIPIIAVTAYAGEDDKNEFLSKGMSHYISKPFLKNDLINLLDGIF